MLAYLERHVQTVSLSGYAEHVQTSSISGQRCLECLHIRKNIFGPACISRKTRLACLHFYRESRLLCISRRTSPDCFTSEKHMQTDCISGNTFLDCLYTVYGKTDFLYIRNDMSRLLSYPECHVYPLAYPNKTTCLDCLHIRKDMSRMLVLAWNENRGFPLLPCQSFPSLTLLNFISMSTSHLPWNYLFNSFSKPPSLNYLPSHPIPYL